MAASYQDLVAGVEGARILDQAGLHMTVIKPWDEKDPDAVIRDFAAVASGPVSVTFDIAESRQDPRGGGMLWLKGSNSPELELLWLQAWRALWSQNPPQAPLPHVTLARFPATTIVPAVPELQSLTVLFDRLCLYESVGDLEYRIIGEKRLDGSL